MLNGEVVRFSGSRPHCSRQLTNGMLRAVKAAYAALTPDERHALICKTNANRVAYPRVDSWSLEDPELTDFGADAPAVFRAMAHGISSIAT